MRFEVPQFIEVEDKIVGPLTWKQFIYLAGGIGILIVCYMILPKILFAIIGLPLAALAGFLAFHRVNNRPFSIFLESFVKYMRNGKLYLWRKEHAQTIVSYRNIPEPKEKLAHSGQKRLTTLAQKLEFYSLEK